MTMLDEQKRRILEGIRQRYGDVALPRSPESMPDEYWRQAARQLSSQPEPRVDGESMMGRAAGLASKGVSVLAGIDDAADRLSGQPGPLGDAGRAYRYGWSPLWDKVLRPTLDRAEDVGQLIGSPIIQNAKDVVTGQGSPLASRREIASDYIQGGKAFLDNIRGEDGVDFRGATEAATDAMDVDPYVAGAAGILFDPTNLIPFVAAPKALQAGRRVVQAGRAAGVGEGVKQAGREAAAGARGFPGALREEYALPGRGRRGQTGTERGATTVAQARGQGQGQATRADMFALLAASQSGEESWQAYRAMSPEQRRQAFPYDGEDGDELLSAGGHPTQAKVEGRFDPAPGLPEESAALVRRLVELSNAGDPIPPELYKAIAEDEGIKSATGKFTGRPDVPAWGRFSSVKGHQTVAAPWSPGARSAEVEDWAELSAKQLDEVLAESPVSLAGLEYGTQRIGRLVQPQYPRLKKHQTKGRIAQYNEDEARYTRELEAHQTRLRKAAAKLGIEEEGRPLTKAEWTQLAKAIFPAGERGTYMQTDFLNESFNTAIRRKQGREANARWQAAEEAKRHPERGIKITLEGEGELSGDLGAQLKRVKEFTAQDAPAGLRQGSRQRVAEHARRMAEIRDAQFARERAAALGARPAPQRGAEKAAPKPGAERAPARSRGVQGVQRVEGKPAAAERQTERAKPEGFFPAKKGNYVVAEVVRDSATTSGSRVVYELRQVHQASRDGDVISVKQLADRGRDKPALDNVGEYKRIGERRSAIGVQRVYVVETLTDEMVAKLSPEGENVEWDSLETAREQMAAAVKGESPAPAAPAAPAAPTAYGPGKRVVDEMQRLHEKFQPTDRQPPLVNPGQQPAGVPRAVGVAEQNAINGVWKPSAKGRVALRVNRSAGNNEVVKVIEDVQRLGVTRHAVLRVMERTHERGNSVILAKGLERTFQEMIGWKPSDMKLLEPILDQLVREGYLGRVVDEPGTFTKGGETRYYLRQEVSDELMQPKAAEEPRVAEPTEGAEHGTQPYTQAALHDVGAAVRDLGLTSKQAERLQSMTIAERKKAIFALRNPDQADELERAAAEGVMAEEAAAGPTPEEVERGAREFTAGADRRRRERINQTQAEARAAREATEQAAPAQEPPGTRIPRERGPAPRPEEPPPAPPPTDEEVGSVTSADEAEAVIEREVVAADAVLDADRAAASGPNVGAPGAPLDAADPQSLYRHFKGTVIGRGLNDQGARVLLQQYMIDGSFGALLEGAGPIEGERLKQLATGVGATPPTPPQPPPQAPPGDRIPRGPGGGDGQFGIPGEPSKRIQVWGDRKQGYGFDTLPLVDKKLALLTKNTPWQKLADWLVAVPGGATVVRVVNASGGLAKADPIVKAKIAQETLGEQFDRDVAPVFGWLEQVGTERQVWGAKDDIGKVDALLSDGRTPAKVYIQEVVEDPKRFKLNARQQKWVTRALRVTALPREIVTALGKGVGEHKTGADLHYTGLLLVKKVDAAGEVIERGWTPMSSKRGLAGTAPFAHDRQFKTLQDAIAAGFSPEPSYIANMRVRMAQAGRQSVNIRVSDYLGQALKRTKEGAEGGLEGVSLRKDEGELKLGEALIHLQLNTKRGSYEKYDPTAPWAGKAGEQGKTGKNVTRWTTGNEVRERRYRIYGPKAAGLSKFMDELKYEHELRDANKLLTGAAKFGAVSRLAVLTMDGSVWTMQAGFALAAHPLHGAQQVPEMAKAFVESLFAPETARRARGELLAKFADSGGYEKHPYLVTDYGRLSEFTEASEGVLGRIPVAGEALQRFALSFDYLRDIVAVRFAELADEAGMTQEAKNAHDRMINKMLGRLHSRALGVSANQRLYEGALFMLAPQYFRATLGMFAQMAEGGVSGRMAMKLVARASGVFTMLVAGAAMGLGAARGDTEDQIRQDVARALNPTSREFLSVKVGSGSDAFRVGLGGMPRAFLSLLSELAVGEEFMTDQRKQPGNPVQERARTTERFWEARQAPAVNMLWQYVRGGGLHWQGHGAHGSGGPGGSRRRTCSRSSSSPRSRTSTRRISASRWG